MRINKYINQKNIIKVVANIFRYVFLLSISYVLLYPFLYVAINSIKNYSDIYDVTVNWVPKTPTFDNFAYAFKSFNFDTAFLNTIVYEIVTALIQFASCAVAAYGLARFKLKGKSILIGIMILNILVPSIMIITPSYVNFASLNIVGTPLVFYLPALCGVGLKGGLFIYIYMQFFKGLPKELEEAASIDGAGPWRTFLSVVIPSSGSAMITVLLFSIVWHWNDYYLAQMYMDEQTLSVAVKAAGDSLAADALGGDVTLARMLNKQILLAGCMLFLLPLIIFYLFMQKKFMASIATSGIVG